MTISKFQHRKVFSFGPHLTCTANLRFFQFPTLFYVDIWRTELERCCTPQKVGKTKTRTCSVRNTILGRTHCTAWFSCHPCPPTGTLQSLMIKVRILFLTPRPPLYYLKMTGQLCRFPFCSRSLRCFTPSLCSRVRHWRRRSSLSSARWSCAF